MSLYAREALAQQYGAAIDALENAIVACPDDVWSAGPPWQQFWYLASHTLFWLDHYLAGTPEGFQPPPPYGLEEMDPAGVLPPRVYTTRSRHSRASIRGATAASSNCTSTACATSSTTPRSSSCCCARPATSRPAG